MGGPQISIVIVNFRVEDLLEKCLESLERAGGKRPLEIIVVDNAATGACEGLIRRRFPSVQLICSPENLGFARATNRGLAIATGRAVLLLNPDTVVLPGVLDELWNVLWSDPMIGAVGPKLLNPDGSLQKSCMSFPGVLNTAVFAFGFGRWLPEVHQLPSIFTARWAHDTRATVDYLIGAALMTKPEVLKQIGDLDEGFFLYAEEKDWCFRLGAAGFRTVYVPEVSVIHYGGQSSGQVRVFALHQLHRSQEYFFHKHYSAPRAFIMKWILRSSLGIKALVLGLLYGVSGGRVVTYREGALCRLRVLRLLVEGASRG